MEHQPMAKQNSHKSAPDMTCSTRLSSQSWLDVKLTDLEESFLNLVVNDEHKESSHFRSFETALSQITQSVLDDQALPSHHSDRLAHFLHNVAHTARAIEKVENDLERTTQDVVLPTKGLLAARGASAFIIPRSKRTAHSANSKARVTKASPGGKDKDVETQHYRHWFSQNLAHPFPTTEAKKQLLSVTPGQNAKQLATWFTNARIRSGWKELHQHYAVGKAPDALQKVFARIAEGTASTKEIQDVQKVRDWIENHGKERAEIGTLMEALEKGRRANAEAKKKEEARVERQRKRYQESTSSLITPGIIRFDPTARRSQTDIPVSSSSSDVSGAIVPLPLPIVESPPNTVAFSTPSPPSSNRNSGSFESPLDFAGALNAPDLSSSPAASSYSTDASSPASFLSLASTPGRPPSEVRSSSTSDILDPTYLASLLWPENPAPIYSRESPPLSSHTPELGDPFLSCPVTTRRPTSLPVLPSSTSVEEATDTRAPSPSPPSTNLSFATSGDPFDLQSDSTSSSLIPSLNPSLSVANPFFATLAEHPFGIPGKEWNVDDWLQWSAGIGTRGLFGDLGGYAST